MNNLLDRLQQAWQSQCSKPIDVKPDQLLKTARLERRAHFWVDMFLISLFLCIGIFTLRSTFRDIQKDWPWLIYSASLAWVVGYVLINRWRQRRYAAHYDDSVLAHVEWSIKDIEHRMWLDRTQTLWYVLPIALGCIIPPVFFAAMDFSSTRLLHDLGILFGLLFTLGVFAAVFYFVHWIMKKGRRLGLERQRQELEALRALRETLLNTEEPHV